MTWQMHLKALPVAACLALAVVSGITTPETTMVAEPAIEALSTPQENTVPEARQYALKPQI